MNLPLINLLIRNKYRPELLRRCLNSISYQDYPNINVIACSDTTEASLDFTTTDCYKSWLRPRIRSQHFNVAKGTHRHFWNLYCNELKKSVYDGWFMFLDNDDYLRPGALTDLAPHLTDPNVGVICQFLRNDKPKPSDALIKSGKILKGLIGGGCIALHYSQKYTADWDDDVAADFRYIKAVSEKIKLKFVPVIVQIAGNNGLHGK